MFKRSPVLFAFLISPLLLSPKNENDMKMLVTLLAACFLYGCNVNGKSFITDQKIDTTIYFTQFPQTDSIRFSSFLQHETDYVRAVLVTDTSLILTNDKGLMSGHFFLEYSLRTKEPAGKYIKGGRHKGMTLGPVTFGLFKKQYLFVKDIALNKLIVADLSQKHGPDSLVIEEYPSNQRTYTEHLLSENLVLQSGILDASREIMHVRDIKTDSLVRAFGSLPEAPGRVPFGSWKHANMNFLFVKPDATRAVIAWRYAAKTEVFDLDTEKGAIAIGPKEIEPSFLPIDAGGIQMSQVTEKTTYTYRGGSVTDKYIYLLYYGKTTDTPFFTDGNLIFVFDWNGNPVRELRLDRYIQGFAVNDDDSILYAFDGENRQVVTARLQ